MIKTDDKRYGFLLSITIAFIGGILFTVLHTPIPWLLGPMASILIGARLGKIQLYWPSWFRNAGLIIVGYSIGLSFSKNALIQILKQLPTMLMMTVLLVLFCAGIAFVVSKLTGVDYPTVLTGSIPGGLSQMIIFAEEVKGIDLTTVTFLQVARLMMIIFFVPFLVFGPIFQGTGKVSSESLLHTVQTPNTSIIWLAIICVICAILAKRLKFPTPFLLGPILGTAIVNISGLHGPALPVTILDLSQFMIGGYIGLLLKPEKLQHKARVITLALISGMVMILGSLGLSLLLVSQEHITASTSFLSVAPGGMDQMGILAHEVQADLSMVTGFQLFRLFFIYFVVPPLLRLIFKIGLKKETITT
ncbi:AbrB family transcriptional regulator [Bacillus sp. MUM 116]|uniref:AbrB family transcriptional regulator n=1 Tax=Bacillus sp. MUM 116 TaxID=1678002 RepID=UPI0008F5A094|nr:AbrB family transcriptional regulator [Bacillus sp. MUM 116]OIK08618.1 AbrB family transcriptional regulator [Bacillus sp. MUM 116]